jgi:hypothetical protein
MSRLSTLLQHPHFAGFFEALAADPTDGRVFFVSNYQQITGDDGVVTPTTVNSMTPYFTGREIVGGTFSHWSPVARWLWVGDPWAELLPAQVESGDNRQLFGRAWRELTAEEIVTNLHRLNVTTLVVNTNEPEVVAFFDAYPHFTRYWQNSGFVLYHLTGNSSTWVEAQGPTVSLLERHPLHWRIAVESSAANATLLVKMAHYPLWQAQAEGNTLRIVPTREGLQEIVLPPGGPYTVELTYRYGVAEWSGLLITVLSVLVIGWLFLPRPTRGRAANELVADS